jgi:hypothetical protein
MPTTVARLSSNGVYFTNTYFDEVTYTSNKINTTALYSGGFDEVTIQGSNIAKRETYDSQLLVSRYFDEVTGISTTTTISPLAGLVFDLDAANYSALPVNGSTDATGTYSLSVTNAGASISYISSNGGYFSKSNNVGTDSIIAGPNYTSTSQSYSVFMAYAVNTTAGGRLLNTNNEATNDWLLGSYFSSLYYKNVWYPNASLNLTVDSYTVDSGWNFIWATYDATTGTANLYISSSTVNNTSGPTAFYKQAVYGVSSRGFNQLRLWSRSGGSEVQSGKIGLVKVYNRVLSVSDIQTLWSQYHSRFGI